MKLIGMICPHLTPKFEVGGGTAYTLSSRDHKGVMCVVLSTSDRKSNGELPSRELLRTGRIQRYVCSGEQEWNGNIGMAEK